MEDKVIDIIKKVTGCDEININTQTDLLDSNIIDSLAFIQLLSKLEDEFNIEIQPTLVDPNTWRNVKKIVEFVKKKVK